MEKPNFSEMGERLLEYSQNLKENSQIGNSKLIFAIAEMIRVMAWQGSEQAISNSQITHSINEIKILRGTIEEANKKSEELERANHRIQIMLLVLTAVGTLVIVFPILKVLFEWLSNIFIFPISGDIINAISGVLAAVISLSSFWQTKKALSQLKK